MRIVALDAFSIDQGELAWDEMASLGELVVHPRTRPIELFERGRGAEALLTNKVRLLRADIEAWPELRYIGVVATGANVIDFDVCREREIAVTNVPGYAAASVAQFVFALLLQFIEDVPSYVARVKENGWAESPDYCFLLRPRALLAGRTLAILGLGSIGRQVATIAEAFGMRVLHAAVPGSTTRRRVPLFAALGQADFVSLHAPLTSSTHRLVNRAFLSAMKPGAVLINTSRGALIDEAALLEALLRGTLGGALLDVLEEEPPMRDHPLLDPNAPFAPRVLVTPHIAWATTEARRQLIREAAENLAAFLKGERRNRLD